MNIVSIKTFLAVVRIGNLNRASVEMNITQSAVTARLDALDQSLGARLLNRSRKGATLTKAGYAFLEQAEVIARMWDTAKTRISLPQGVSSLFSLVCDPALWDGVGDVWLDQLRSDHRDIAFEVWTARPQEALAWLTSGISDAALLSEPLTGADLASRIFLNDPLIQVGTQPRSCIKWDPDYVFVDYGPDFRAQHAESWPGEEMANMTFSNPEWAMSHILKNGGSAYLPMSLVASKLKDGSLFPILGAPEFDRKVYLNWRIHCEEQFGWLM